jgi:hypothetical protein
LLDWTAADTWLARFHLERLAKQASWSVLGRRFYDRTKDSGMRFVTFANGRSNSGKTGWPYNPALRNGSIIPRPSVACTSLHINKGISVAGISHVGKEALQYHFQYNIENTSK